MKTIAVTPVLVHRRSQSLDHSLAIVRHPLLAFIPTSLVAECRRVVEAGVYWVREDA